MRVVSWNVNGIRACVRHGFVDFVDRSGADIVGQEVRARPEDIPPAARRPPDWHTAFTVAERRGYSGVGLYSKLQPVRVDTSLGVPRSTERGGSWPRTSRTARGRFVVVNGYFPKGSGPARDNSRVGYKLDFSRTVFARAQALRRRGPVLVIGDYNTAHRMFDLARPRAVMPSVAHSTDRYANNRAEVSHQPTRQREPGDFVRCPRRPGVPPGALRDRAFQTCRRGIRTPKQEVDSRPGDVLPEHGFPHGHQCAPRAVAWQSRRGGVATGRRSRPPRSWLAPDCRSKALLNLRPGSGCFRHQLLLPRPYLVLTKPLRLDIQCQRAASVKIGWKYLDD